MAYITIFNHVFLARVSSLIEGTLTSNLHLQFLDPLDHVFFGHLFHGRLNGLILLFDLPSQKLHFLLYLLQGLLKLPCQCLDGDRLCKVICYRLTILGGFKAEYFVLAFLGFLGAQVALDALSLAGAASLVFFFLQLVHRLVDVPLKVVRDFRGQDKDPVTMRDNSLVLGVRIHIGVLIVSRASQTVEAQGYAFVLKQGQKQVFKVFALIS